MNFNFIGIKNISRATLLFVATGVFSSPLWAQQAPEKTQDEETTRDIRWGNAGESGLRLGAFRLDKTPTIFCVLENTEENPVGFNNYDLGYARKSVSVQARLKGTKNWEEISSTRLKGVPQRIGPTQKNNITLAPHQYYRALDEYFSVGLPYNTPIISDSEFDLLKRESERSSFWINIYDYKWPTAWSGTVEFEIRQKLPNFNLPNQWQGELTSGILEIDAATARAAERQASYQTIIMKRQLNQDAKPEQNTTKTESQK